MPKVNREATQVMHEAPWVAKVCVPLPNDRQLVLFTVVVLVEMSVGGQLTSALVAAESIRL